LRVRSVKSPSWRVRTRAPSPVRHRSRTRQGAS
jgi:hypothetical protein